MEINLEANLGRINQTGKQWNPQATNVFITLVTAIVITLTINSASAIETDKKDTNSRETTDMEAATRLQVFLDRAEFAPGKIDGRHGEFTLKALALYRQAHDEKPSPSAENNELKPGDTPDVSGLDFAGIDPLFITYTVTEADIQSVGELPDSVPEQAKLKALPYQTVAEVIAEKFHTDLDFLKALNAGKTKTMKAGDQLKVPNVAPFDLSKVKSLKVGNETAAQDANKAPGKEDTKNKKESSESTMVTTEIKIDIATSMLGVYADGKIIAAYPVTIGSEQTESPIGEWKVQGVAKMPDFRHDKAMLKKGERSDEFHMIPPGPNNPVGVIWISLNKKGIGLHGTSDPDSIGRSVSHGCVRLANWDVVRLAEKVKAGVPVSIR